MAMKPTDFAGAVPVDGYGPGFFRVGGKVIEGAVIVQYSGGRAWGGLQDRDALLALGGQVDVLFLGMGADIAHAPADLVAALKEVGIMVEAMASPTAARIYNVTLSEGRRVACALLPL
ncbi:Mth938-like domain-containing protein [Paracoccus fistulariae]|uniref:Mth938-like domain-containing protein n=1 Tax=Paracoccus fistulariae TaxID=658446 RepID=A0ABY7SNZ4_9RHOB|nr:Mth938-like domain-containing protein [Paracoccus fistulariae]MDB6182423.1 Mth938-like domain-containing protein [Paracoccus fistulariae]WCR08605.1 Mth938-like domain-containing protein [Paracoccus fistulariae]